MVGEIIETIIASLVLKNDIKYVNVYLNLIKQIQHHKFEQKLKLIGENNYF